MREVNLDQPEGPNALVFEHREVIRQILTKYDATLLDQDRAPVWAILTAGAFYATAWMGLHGDLTPPEIFDRVRNSSELKSVLLVAYRCGSTSLELMDLIMKGTDE